MNPEILPRPAGMCAKWTADGRQDSPSFHIGSKRHDYGVGWFTSGWVPFSSGRGTLGDKFASV